MFGETKDRIEALERRIAALEKVVGEPITVALDVPAIGRRGFPIYSRDISLAATTRLILSHLGLRLKDVAAVPPHAVLEPTLAAKVGKTGRGR